MGQKQGLHLEICADFHEFWIENQNKSSYLKKLANFHEFRGKTTKKRIFITKSAKKQFWPTNSEAITSILGVSGLELHFSGTEPVTFFGAQSSLGGQSSCLRGTAREFPPGASGLLQVYSNLSNCNYRIFVKEILLEIGFIEEMKTI